MNSKSGLKKVAFRLIALLLPLIAAEAAVRSYDLLRGHSVRARANWYWAFTQDRFLGYRHRANVRMTLAHDVELVTNSAGFRNEELAIEPSAPRRLVVCLGESSTWGIHAPDTSSTWPKRLEKLLQQADPRFVVLNAALPGYTTVENLELLKLNIVKYQPEAVIYMGMRNDFRAYAGCLQPDLDFNHYRRMFAELPRTPVNELLMRSSLWAALMTPLRHYLSDERFFPTKYLSVCTPRGEALFRDQVSLMSDVCRRHDIQLLWVDQPINYTDREGGLLRPGFESLRGILHDELSRQNVSLLQAHGIYDHRSYPLRDDVHYSPEGMEYLAELLAPRVLEQLGPR